jgi:hypothetical protein
VTGVYGRDKQLRRFAGISGKPSDGLEPSTPSLPWRFLGGTRVHVRASAIAFDLQIGALRRVTRVLAYPRVVDLMYPSRTCTLLSVLKTDNEQCGLKLALPAVASVATSSGLGTT